MRGPEKPEIPETPDVPDFGSGSGGSNSAVAPTDYPTMAGGFYTYTQPTYTPVVPSLPSSTIGSSNNMVTSAAESRAVQSWVGVGCTMFGFLVAAS